MLNFGSSVFKGGTDAIYQERMQMKSMKTFEFDLLFIINAEFPKRKLEIRKFREIMVYVLYHFHRSHNMDIIHADNQAPSFVGIGFYVNIKKPHE